MYESMYNKAKETNADLVICDYLNELDHKSEYRHQKITTDKKRIFYLIANQKIHCSFCNKLIKHSLAKKYRLEKRIDIWEDMAIISCILLEAKSIIKIDNGLYHYYLGKSDSLTKNKTIPRVMSFIKSVEYITTQLYYTNNISLINVNDLYLLQWKAKRDLISNSKNDLKLWNDIFPECNKEYMHIGLTIKRKILSYLAMHRYARIISIIFKIKHVSSSIIKQYFKTMLSERSYLC